MFKIQFSDTLNRKYVQKKMDVILWLTEITSPILFLITGKNATIFISFLLSLFLFLYSGHSENWGKQKTKLCVEMWD